MYLLNRTIKSILQQTYTEWLIFVIYTNDPSEKESDSRVNYISSPFPFQQWEELENNEILFQQIQSKQKVVHRWDKSRKLGYGAHLAKESGCHYIMALDSDDLLSKFFLSSLVADTKRKKCHGWYLDTGYLYREGSTFLLRVPKYMCGLNGSTHVLHSDLVKIPDFRSLDWQDHNLFTDHGSVRARVKEVFNVQLEPVLQPYLVYVVHSSNISQVNRKEFGLHLKAIVKRILRYVPLTKKIREEFSL